MTYQLTEYEKKTIAAAMVAYDYSYEKAVELQQQGNFHLHENKSLYQVAYEIAHKVMGDHNRMKFCKKYFDYQAFAIDLSKEGYTQTQYGVIAEDRI